MHELAEQTPAVSFPDRRQTSSGPRAFGERRQFVDSRSALRPEVAELAEAVDQYKLRHRRRFITFEELFDVMWGLGYRKVADEA
jgi:hypothetical protein